MFLFKQKTAYEVRISDWSSDVCSSDLPLRGRFLLLLDLGAALGQLGRGLGLQLGFFLVAQSVALALPGHVRAGLVVDDPARRVEIGRASCRERVCQYV